MRTTNWMNRLQGLNESYYRQDSEVDEKSINIIDESVKSIDIIKELIDTSWGGDNESQGKAVQLLKGLAFSDEESSNKFMSALDKFTSELNADDFV